MSEKNFDLNEKHVKLRIVAFVVFLLVAIAALIFAFSSLLKGSDGYQTITTGSGDNSYMDDELVFTYNIGVNPNKPSNELKTIINLYSEYVEYSYKLLDSDQGYDGVNNLYYINNHLNETIKIDSLIYDSFKTLSDNNMLYLVYLGPLYTQTFSIINEKNVLDYSPSHNENVRSFYSDIITYINSGSIYLELLDNNCIKLNVSTDYLSYIETNEINSIISLSYLKNAIMVDYIASNLESKGHTYGMISSLNGYIRILDETTNYTYSIFDYVNGRSLVASKISFTKSAIVNIKNFSYLSTDYLYMYQYNDELYTYYINNKGNYTNDKKSLLMYSYTASCFDILLQILNSYFNSISNDKINSLNNIFTIYCNNMNIYYNDNNITLFNIETVDGIKYEEAYIGV